MGDDSGCTLITAAGLICFAIILSKLIDLLIAAIT